MKITVDDERYEALMIDYQITEIARLNEVLKRHGIADPAARQSICARLVLRANDFGVKQMNEMRSAKACNVSGEYSLVKAAAEKYAGDKKLTRRNPEDCQS